MKYRFRSPLYREKAVEKLREKTEVTSLFSYFRKKRPVVSWFRGEVEEESFEITRSIQYSKPYLPVVKGKIIPVGGQTEIELKFYLRLETLLSYLGVGIVVIGFYLREVIRIFSEGNRPHWFIFIPLIGYFLLLFFAVVLPYLVNVNYAKSEIKEILGVVDDKELV